MNKFKYYIAGFGFLVVALISLYVVLSWPHPTTKTQAPMFEGPTTTLTTPRGMPFIWVYDKKEVTHVFPEPERNMNNRQIKTPKLLGNLIVWGAGLCVIAFALGWVDRKLIG